MCDDGEAMWRQHLCRHPLVMVTRWRRWKIRWKVSPASPWQNVLSRSWWHMVCGDVEVSWSLNFKSIRHQMHSHSVQSQQHPASFEMERVSRTISAIYIRTLKLQLYTSSSTSCVVHNIFMGKICPNSISKLCSSVSMMATTAARATGGWRTPITMATCTKYRCRY